jgi:TonB-dependent SusC/RagA subfamily outer membrane receptor
MKRIFTAALLLVSAALHSHNTVTDTLGFLTAASGNAAEFLRGQISNVRVSSIDGNPVGGVNVNIRGINSLRSDNQPLWIVDGIMLSTDLNQNLDAFWQYGEQSYTAPLNPLAFLNANEIESIEVLKDVTSTALYGTLGANGVVIVKTKMPSSGERNFTWNSDFGYNGGFNTNHYAALQGTADKTAYNMSLSYRRIDSSLKRNHSDYGLFKGNFHTKANKVVWFGFNALLGLGVSESPTGVAYLGRPSLTLGMRDESLSSFTSAQTWTSDYDDQTDDYRALLGGWLRFNFGNFVHMKFNVGLDLQNNSRSIW